MSSLNCLVSMLAAAADPTNTADITAPTQITFGRHDQITSQRFVKPLKTIKNSELVIFDTASHAPIYEVYEEFNQKTLEFLQRHAEEKSSVSAT